MKLLTDWGFSVNSWQGQRGEYWVFAQAAIIVSFMVLPVYPLPARTLALSTLYGLWAAAGVLGVLALVLMAKGLLDLGRSLTPLPHPRDDAQLVQSGVYSLVRHPLYSGLIVAALSWALYQRSLSHLAGAIVIFVFFNAKATLEETWLRQKYPEYGAYQQRVKKLIPWLY
ncbi:isoprenylcysteine carboxylmethyltransferase family protein [Leptolyngbya sp. FACHB-321]|uniref:methyltransferase family protein n=1 Tax=Leptolyngbya sp. FACHB-321 TaxID=2692807 RepID=UPI001689B077|nr:isoprenylcysteine carboxylmethyltransferase family protein [Leptolyngbya sp. FACHB-321]MBD2034409.1 isoprenylcysteine carboxylmethyltransferase family protein [Leptolyngbya sp. FACHB-321]